MVGHRPLEASILVRIQVPQLKNRIGGVEMLRENIDSPIDV